MFKIYEEPASQVICADRGCKFFCQRSHKAEKSQVIRSTVAETCCQFVCQRSHKRAKIEVTSEPPLGQGLRSHK